MHDEGRTVLALHQVLRLNGRTVGRSDGHIVQTHGGVVRIEDLIGHAGVETDPGVIA